MDILKPELHWMGSKRCYRVNPILADDESHLEKENKTTEYIENDLYDDECDEEMYEINETNPGVFKTSFHVAQPFFGRIIGARGATKQRIEGETKAQITIPRQGRNEDIVITGGSRENVASARQRIEMIVLSSRQKQPPTHFFGVRIQTDQIKENYERFKQEVLNGPPIFGLTEKMFTPTEKLHLTFAVMPLMDNEDRLNAAEYLNDCLENIVLPTKQRFGRITAKVNGLEIMNDDPSEVRVLYARVESESLQLIGDQMYQYFIAKGLSKREFDRDTVKMHMTLINVRYGEETEETVGDNGRRRYNRKHFDARTILENFREFQFGEVEINQIELSTMHTVASDGFYESSATINF